MTTRTTISSVTFRRPFRLPEMDRAYPPGTYEVEVDEEELDSLLLAGYRRTGTRIRLQSSGVTEFLNVTRDDLDTALADDASAANQEANVNDDDA
jgi:hypothetical protein